MTYFVTNTKFAIGTKRRHFYIEAKDLDAAQIKVWTRLKHHDFMVTESEKNIVTMDDIVKVTIIVAEHTGKIAIHNADKDHEEQKKSRQSCCWSSPLIKDGYEIAVCQPSIRSKGDTACAFFTFKRI